MNKYNIVWILVDSVRRYHTIGDDRSRLPIMDEFAKESVEFLNTVTSAPSTVMSVSAMMTSLPAYFLSRNYDSFQMGSANFISIKDILQELGYSTYAFCRHVEARENLKHLLSLVDKKYWPKGYHFDHYWSNQDVNKIYNNLYESENLNKPSFMFFDYNCRKDPGISDTIKDLLKNLNKNGFTDDNTIFILCSDHGYPDPKRGFSPEEFTRRNLGHDVHLTDDNIMIPLIIRYPGCQKGLKVQSTVSTLDVMPTILDIIGIDYSGYDLKGRSLLNVIENDNGDIVKVRADNRFMAQKGRGTSIRGRRYKYIFHHDTKEEEFYDLQNDKWEINNLIKTDDTSLLNKIDEYRDEFKRQEKEAISFQFEYLIRNFKQNTPDNIKGSKLDILILASSEDAYYELLHKVLSESFKESKIYSHFLEDGSDQNENNLFDLVVVPYDNQDNEQYQSLLKVAKRFRKKKQIVIDYNMNIHKKEGVWLKHAKRIYSRRLEYLRDPALLFSDFADYGSVIAQKVGRKIGLVKEDWNSIKGKA